MGLVLMIVILVVIYLILRHGSRWVRILVLGLIIAVFLVPEIFLSVLLDWPRCTEDKQGFLPNLFCRISAKYESYVPYFRSPPTDEEMIAHFQRHRADFERLVQIYRENLSLPTEIDYLFRTPEVSAIMDRIHVAHVSGDGVIWMPPDPYSTKRNPEKEKLDASWHSQEGRKFAGVIFHYRHAKSRTLSYLAPVYKHYYYFPFAPKIRDGKLIIPACLLTGGTGGLFQTLNMYPPDFKPFDCVYREIEPQWFIMMCQEK